MKAQAQKIPSPAARSERSAIKNPRPKTRSGAGNRRRADALERQAEGIASYIAQGGAQVNERIRPARAAGFFVPGSAGNPLSGSVAAHFESLFGAGLSAVRIHVGAEADEAARELHAEAFTSGRDIYFRSGRYAPQSSAGRELLAHELVHVLQQTGRVGADGRLHATGVRGDAAPQLSSTPGADVIKRSGLTFDQLVSTHRNDDDVQDADLEQAIKLAKADLGGTLQPSSTAADALEASVLRSGSAHADLVNRSPRARSFFYDCLKFTDRWKGALTLLHRDHMLRTFAVILDPFVMMSYTKSYGLGWLAEMTDLNAELAGVWPKKFVQSIRNYAVGPTRAVPSIMLSTGITIPEAFKKAKDDWYQANPSGLAANELHFAAYGALNELDRLRISGLAKIDQEQKAYFSAEKEYNPLAVRDYIARRILHWGKTLEENGQPEELMRPFGKQIHDLGEKLVEFWKTVFNTGKLSFSASTPGTGVNQPAPPPVVPNDKVLLSELPQALLKALETVSKLADKQKIPTAQVYLSQVNSASTVLGRFFLNKLELPLTGLFDGEDTGKALAYAWFLFRGHELLRFIKSYDQAADLEFAKKWQNRADIRFAHRWEVALRIRQWIDQLEGNQPKDWAALRTSAQAVLNNLAQQHSELALLGDYEQDTRSKVDKLKEDFPAGIVEFGAIPIADIVLLIQAIYASDLAAKVKRLLADDAADSAADPKAALERGPILNQAVDAVNASSRPMRWHVKDYIYAENPDDVQGFNTDEGANFIEKSAVLPELIRSHPKSEAAAMREMGKNNFVVFPSRDPQGVFFWAFPQFDRILETLRSDAAGLNAFMAQAHFMGRQPTPGELTGKIAEIKALDSLDWIKALAKAPEWMLKLREFTKALHAKSISERDVQVRLAVSHERRRLARLVDEAMKKFTGRADGTWDLPLDLLTYIERFGAWVIPEEDRLPQLAAVFLALAPTLRKALAGERRFDIITRYYGHLVLALTYSEGSKISELARIIPDEQERTGLINQRTHLLELRKALDQVRAEVQGRFGFKGEANKYLKSFVYSETINPNVPFKIDGVQYQLIKVHANFSYNQAYGHDPGPNAPPGTGAYRPPMLDGKVYGEEYHPTGRKLFTVLIDGQRFDITDRDTSALDQFSHVVEMRANIIGLEATLRVMEGFAELALDLAELVPGVGQAVMATRIIATVVQFLAGGEFEDIKRLVTNEPFEMVKKLFSELEEMMTPDKAWEFLLFGSPWVDSMLARQHTSNRSRRATSSGGRKSPLRKIMLGVQGIRRGVGRAFRSLHDHIQMPVDSLQASVLARPRLAWGVGLIAGQIHHLPQLVDGLKAAGRWNEFIEGFSVDDAETMLQGRVQEILDGLAHVHLPEKVVPFDRVIAAVIDLILGRFGTKGKAIRAVMDATGLTDEVASMIAEELEGTAVDPNEPWREDVLPLFESRFYDMQTAFVDGLYNLLTGPPLSLQLKRPEAQQVKLTTVGDAFEGDEEMGDAAPYDGGDPDPQAIASLPSPRGGDRLAPGVRVRAQAEYGHDFSHVRLHTGADAARATRAFGADGLASGSHVYLRPGLSPETGAGRKVLNHELAHVLQQAGPRPLGQWHGTEPVRGSRGGVGWNPGAEQQAEAMSRRSGRAGAKGPVPVLRSPLGEWQPSILSIQTVRKLLRKLSDFETIKETQQEIDRRAAGPTAPDIEDTEITKAKKVWHDLWEMLKANFTTPKGNFYPARPSLQTVGTELKDYLAGHHAGIVKALPWLAAGSQKVSRKKNPDKTVTETKTLKIDAFAKQLESYILAKTGVALLFTADKDTGAVTEVRITNLVIIMVGGGAGLWEKALTNAGVTGDVTEIRMALRALLRAAGVRTEVSTTDANGAPKTVPIWAVGKFAFHADMIQMARDHIQAEATKGRPDDVPRYKKYLEINDATPGPVIGHRIGRYGDKTQRGPDRESHHTTQWLLIEYFRNQTGFLPFPKSEQAGWRAAGIGFEGTAATRFENPSDSSQKVAFKDLDKGDRGEAMPAILLAKKTHREGDLHVKGATPEDFGSDRPTQSGAVHDVFQKAVFKGDFEKWKDAPDFNAKAQAEPSRFASQVHSALQDTYAWMYRKMEPALEKALPTIEMTYYLEIAERHHMLDKGQPTERLHPDWDPPASAFEAISGAAKANNDKIMGSSGWKAPY